MGAGLFVVTSLGAAIARLREDGLDQQRIAEQLGIPVERVAEHLADSEAAPAGPSGEDRVTDDSFPASDPPPGPGA
jgi:hypothetical protein